MFDEAPKNRSFEFRPGFVVHDHDPAILSRIPVLDG
jgi:hypothetical protein